MQKGNCFLFLTVLVYETTFLDKLKWGRCCFDWSGNQRQEETILGGAMTMKLWDFQLDVRNHRQPVEICRTEVK